MLRIFLGTSSYRRMFNLITIVFLLLGILGTGAPSAFASSSLFQQGVVAFLYPPYPGSVAENSIFDHSSPTYNADGNDYVVAWNGVQNTTLSYDGHPGIDYGTNFLPILAAADSNLVDYAGWDNPLDHRGANLGLFVQLHHQNGYKTLYGHLSAIAVQACTTPGCASVAHGDTIGISGNTGNSSGPHLHFEVRKPDGAIFKPVDPYGWSGTINSTVPEDPWQYNQPNSLWVVIPDISVETANTTVLPLGSGNAIPPSDGPVGGVIVDDNANGNSPNFSQVPTGCWSSSNPVSVAWAENGRNLYHSETILADPDNHPNPTCTAKWTLPLSQPTGEYGIYIRIPRPEAISSNNMPIDGAVYRVHAGENTSGDIIINQQQISEYVLMASGASNDVTVEAGWIYIGNYNFAQEDQNYVELTNLRYGPSLYRNVISWVPYIDEWLTAADPIVMADAVKFVSTMSRNIDIALIIDSSGSMGSNDPGNKRLQASRFFVTSAAIQGDYVGIVDFDSSARVATNPPLQKLHENNASVIAAINTINSSGGTNIGNGVQSGCDILNLSDRSDYKKGAILLTDGIGSFSGQDQCFKNKGWPIFTFGFGQANDTQLQQIAFNTGGRYKRVSNLNSLTCEFIRVRSLIANVEPPPCLPYNVPQLASIFFSQTVAPGQAQATFSTGWPGSDVVMTLTSPSGRVIDRNTVAPDVIHENGSTYEVYTIANPEAGIWQVNLYGANVPAAGEEVIFGFASVPALEGGFPSTPVLDDYNRANGAIGGNWTGNPSKYAIASNQLLVTSNDSNSDIYFSGQAFGADQEAYITFANIHATAAEQDLILKAQSSTTWGSGMIEVLYDAPNQRVQVWTWEWPAGWAQHGADIPVTFVNGDTFGARALANGNVEVYKNGELLGTRDVTSWSYYAQGGYIGLWFVGANGARLDDFGGGTLPSGMQALMADAPASTSQTGMTAAQRNVKTNSASPFWQGIPLKTNQIASVTFANLQASVKPQSNGIWGENTVQVLYDVPNQRIQVWRYDPAKGWTQIGKDIPTKFTAGDVFTVRVLSGGTLEISHNGKLLAKRKASP